jgi:hypothetical protein
MYKGMTICVFSVATTLMAANQSNPPASKVCSGDCSVSRNAKEVCFRPDGNFNGSRLFARNNDILIKVCHNNPAGGQYRVMVDEEVVEEQALSWAAAFLPAVSTSNTAPAPGAQAQTDPSQEIETDAPGTALATAESTATQLNGLVGSLDATFQTVRQDLTALRQAPDLATAKTAADRLAVDLDALGTIQFDSNANKVTLGGTSNSNTTPANPAAGAQNAAMVAQALRQADVKLQAKPMSEAIADFALKRAPLSPQDQVLLKASSLHAPQHDAELKAMSAKVEQYAAFLDVLRTLRALVESVRSQPDCTVLATVVGDRHEARTAALTLQKATADPTTGKLGTFTPVNTVTLTLGQPVFAMTAGFALAPLPKVSFQTLGASTSSASSGSSSGSAGTIGYQEKSSTRVQPMVFLSASLIDGTTSRLPLSLHLTAGFTVANDTLSTNPEFLFGPSVSFLKERFFLTAGAYGGFQQALQTGYSVGGPAPSGSIPTLNQFHWRPGFAISWRIFSASKSNSVASSNAATPAKPAQPAPPANGN